jgi:2-methylisocitrate lyase-like PEP mutase family enzyme
MSAHQARRALRTALAGGDLVVAPGVFDGISAHLVARLGFRAAYLTGAGVAASGFGLPDIGLVTLTEMADRARTAVRVLGDVPLIADADTGYGAELNVVRTVREYEAAGVAALHLEDQAFPKKCGHLPDKELIEPEQFIRKLSAALEARTDSDLVVIARTDARGPLGIDAAIERGRAYAAAGADMVFVEAPESAAEIERIAAEVPGPLLINLVAGGLTPVESSRRLGELGFSVAIQPSLPLGHAALAMLSGLAELAGRDPAEFVPSSPAGFFNLVGLAEWSALGDRFTAVPATKEA